MGRSAREREHAAPVNATYFCLLARPSPAGRYAYEGQGLSARKLRVSGAFRVMRSDGRPLEHSRTSVSVGFLNPRARRWAARVVFCDDGTFLLVTHALSRGKLRPRHGAGFIVQVVVFPERTS